MATLISAISTQSQPPLSFIDLPEEVTFQIFVRVTKLNELQSLLCASREIRKLVSTHFSLWRNFLEIRFPDSFKTISDHPNTFESFRDLQTAKKNMQDNFPVIRILIGHQDELSWMETHQGKLISVGEDCCIKIWDKGEKLEKSIAFAAGEITRGMGIYQDKLYLISKAKGGYDGHENYISDDVIRVYDLKKENTLTNGNEIALLKIPDATQINRLSTHGNLLFAAYTNERYYPCGNECGISIWDMNTNTLIHAIKLGDNDEITCLASSKNHLFSGHRSGCILVWDLKNFQFLKKLEDLSATSSDDETLGPAIAAMTLHKEHLIYAQGCRITVMDSIDGEKLCYLEDIEEVHRFFHPFDGLLAVSYLSKVVIWDLDAQKWIWQQNGFNHVSCLAMHQGKLFIGSQNKEIEVFDFLHHLKL